MNPIIHSLDPSQSDFMIQSRDGIWSAPNRVPTEIRSSFSVLDQVRTCIWKYRPGSEFIEYRIDPLSSTDPEPGYVMGNVRGITYLKSNWIPFPLQCNGNHWDQIPIRYNPVTWYFSYLSTGNTDRFPSRSSFKEFWSVWTCFKYRTGHTEYQIEEIPVSFGSVPIWYWDRTHTGPMPSLARDDSRWYFVYHDEKE